MLRLWKLIKAMGLPIFCLLFALAFYLVLPAILNTDTRVIFLLAQCAAGAALAVVVWIVGNYIYASYTGDWTEEHHDH